MNHSPRRSHGRTAVTEVVRSALPLFAAAMRHAAAPTLSGGDSGTSVAVATGLVRLDAALGGGLTLGTLALVAGRPRMGSSSLLIGMALAAIKRGEPVAILSERIGEEQLRGRLVLLEARVNGYRLRAGLAGREDRIALDAAHERIPWQLLSLRCKPCVTPFDIEDHLFTYRPRLLVADLQPRPKEEHAPAGGLGNLAAGAEHLAHLAAQHRVAVVVRAILPRRAGVPVRSELPGLGAYADAFATVLLLHRTSEAAQTWTSAAADAPGSLAELQVVRHHGRDLAPVHVKLFFDQRYAALRDCRPG